MPASWEDLVTVALLGTDRRPLPDGPPPSWAGPATDPPRDVTQILLGWAARHRTAVRAGSGLPICPPGPVAPLEDGEPVTAAAAQELREALEPGTAGPAK